MIVIDSGRLVILGPRNRDTSVLRRVTIPMTDDRHQSL